MKIVVFHQMKRGEAGENISFGEEMEKCNNTQLVHGKNSNKQIREHHIPMYLLRSTSKKYYKTTLDKS